MRDTNDKLRTAAEIREIAARLKSEGKCVVFTNGCFDLLHAEHVSLLKQARAIGDRLVVGLNSDSSVKRLKGPSRPINNEADRAAVLSAIQFVDHIVLFDEETPCDLIRELRPDVLVKGGDYTPKTVVGHEIVCSYGGEVQILDTDRGVSTTGTIERILDRHWRGATEASSTEAGNETL